MLATAFTCGIIVEFIQDNQMKKSKPNLKIKEKGEFTSLCKASHRAVHCVLEYLEYWYDIGLPGLFYRGILTV